MNRTLLFRFIVAAAAAAAVPLPEAFDDRKTFRPYIAAAIMVKDEVHSLPLTLESLIDAGVRKLIVFDTGSRDGTQKLLRTYARDNGIDLEMTEGRFIDFATSRNRLLDYARLKSDWLLLLDAGDQVRLPNRTFPSLHNTECGYHTMQVWGDTVFFTIRMIRNDAYWRWHFPVHEYLTLDDGIVTCTRTDCRSAELPSLESAVQLVQDRSISGRSSKKRWVRDAEVLRGVLAKDPTHPRALFYLANTYKQLGRCSDAVPVYEKRVKVRDRGWWEEREASMINLAECLRGEENGDKWAMRLYSETQRIEGLMLLARSAMDEHNDPLRCFAYADLACKAPRPERHLFFQPLEYDQYRFALRDYCKNKIT